MASLLMDEYKSAHAEGDRTGDGESRLCQRVRGDTSFRRRLFIRWRSLLELHRQHDLADVLTALHQGMSFCRFGNRESRMNNRLHFADLD